MSTKAKYVEGLLYPLFAVATLIALWSTIVIVFSVPAYLLPTPTQVAKLIVTDRLYFLSHSLMTAAEALAGLTIAIIAGLFSAAVLASSPRIRIGALPIIIASQTIPIIALAPIVVLWLGAAFASKVAMAAIMCWFPLVMSATRGFLEVDPAIKAVFEVYRASRFKTFFKLQFPSGLILVMSGLRISAGMAMIGAIVAEYVGADRGLGYVITQASYRLDTDRLFAAVICGAIVSVALAQIVYIIGVWLLRGVLRR